MSRMVFVVEAQQPIRMDGSRLVGVYTAEELAVAVCASRNTDENMNWFSWTEVEVLGQSGPQDSVEVL